ncbi:sugar transporter [Paraburkholderia sp. Tr-20389]|uniref:polysaccharide biosynthesis/export family protein n=1 Tax=Paraburkholderia sp. Tr-20389 TaxID=2703903 RepID=UPI001981F18A|nr:polysaccharide biosynthesis/export family protein [Paraburkholderia sp. Tr-20389]MBN3757146.1 sugar transporter [Paraburkholderia sp. Tr-20389]
MNIKRLLALLATTALCACSIAPGPYLDTKRLDQTQQATMSAPTYAVRPIDVSWFQEQRAAAVPSVCQLTCLTPTLRSHPPEYRVGIGDQLAIIVWDHPELTGSPLAAGGTAPLPTLQGNTGTGPNGVPMTGSTAPSAAPATGGASAGGADSGLVVRVANDGTIFFPRVGRVKVASMPGTPNMTAQEIQRLIAKGLAKTIRDPQVDVRVAGFNSQSIQVTGNVRAPTPEALTDQPLSVLDAINRAGGALADADLQNVGVTRDGKRYTIDVAALLETGDPNQNVILKDGDFIDVPDRSNSRVFVLGEVGKPTSLPMNRGRLTLADAITGANSLDIATGDPRSIYVIRGADKSLDPSIFRLDMTQVDAIMLMTKFDLQPKDVVYVQVANSARFNRTLAQVLPALQTLFFTRELAR